MERILLLEDDKSLVTGLAAALLAAECAAWAVCPASCGGYPSGCWQCSVCSWQVQRRLRCTAR